MSRMKVIIATLGNQLALAEACGSRLTDAWPAGEPPLFTIASGIGLQAADVHDVDGVVIVASREADQSLVLALLSMLEESCVPILALLDMLLPSGNSYEFAGALVHRQDEKDVVLGAMLHGMLYRQQEVRRLRGEVALAHRCHGGLKGQIAKLHEELQLAAMVQREFLPRELVSLHGVHFAALWRPTNYVSGDIYDVIRLDEDHMGLFIADAIGHGVPAALMTMVICRSLMVKEISGSTYRLVPPSEVLARLNADLIRRQGRSTRFATAAYAVVDCRRRMMTFAGAGHPPPILLGGDGTTRRLETTGGLLGVFVDEEYAQVEIELAAGDRLVMFSDGFEQAFPENAASTGRPTNRYLEEFEALREEPGADAMVRRLRRQIDSQSGSLHQADDLTMLCMVAGPLESVDGADEKSPGGTAVSMPQAGARRGAA